VDGHDVEREEPASEAGGVHEAARGAGIEDRIRCGHFLTAGA
jgi:hypothetical protein